MRAFFLVLAVAVLAGCSSLVRHDGDYFEAAGIDPGRFNADNQTCRLKGDEYLGYNLLGMSGTSYARNRTFNRIYDSCMRAAGYRPRPYVKNLLPP